MSDLTTLAIGRILRLMSRPYQPGDIEEYECCRAIILDASPDNSYIDHRPNWQRDRPIGSQTGD